MAAVKGHAMLLVNAGIAKPSPKVGQALGPLGVNMMEFCKQFNDKTSHFKASAVMRVKVTAYEDRTFDFETFPPSTTWFLKRVTGIRKGASNPGHAKVGTVSLKAIYEIAKVKQAHDPRLSILPLESITKSVASSAKTLGLEITH